MRISQIQIRPRALLFTWCALSLLTLVGQSSPRAQGSAADAESGQPANAVSNHEKPRRETGEAEPAPGDFETKLVDFDTQIVPILTKAGCNAGACHGSAAGRGGFRLSLFGGRPEDDYAAIVHDFAGRRANLAQPPASLVLLKPTGMLEHGGGVRLEWEGSNHKLIERWIAEGARRLESTRLEEFSITPASSVISNTEPSVRLQAFATFSDGTQRDVTAWTVFTPADPAAVEIESTQADLDEEDPATALSVRAAVRRPGQHTVIARYLDRVVPVELLLPVGAAPVSLDWQTANNPVDRHVLKKLEALQLRPSDGADDATYLRRLTLDLIGRLPTPNDIIGFQTSVDTLGRAAARESLVGQLLASDEFTDYWTLRFAKLLRIRSTPGDKNGAAAFAGWVHDSIASSQPLDEMARALLQSEGDTHEIGPANFYRVAADARLQAEYTSELLMGARLRCANCHNHPLDRWTQDDYHGLAAIFAQVQAGRFVETNPRGEVTHPATGEPAVQRIPGEDVVSEGTNGRTQLARWLTAADNPYFARVWVNRLWKAMMGRGLVDPTDDLRATNPATHPELLNQLAAHFVAGGYDIRETLRLIATSETYAASPAPADADATSLAFYVYANPKSLEAEVLADAVSDVTGVWTSYGEYPEGKRAITIYDGAVDAPALDTLGRCVRDESCETTDVQTLRGLASKLHFLNGDWINDRLVDSRGRLRQLLGKDETDAVIVNDFYQLAFSRTATAAEEEYWLAILKETDQAQRPAVLEDFVWALLNSQAFTHNY